jgi:hypothetical protein
MTDLFVDLAIVRVPHDERSTDVDFLELIASGDSHDVT